jgi:NAD(P)-dependent dehydrogenase (short-subunit alcohol dehydrogenase family)
MFLDAGYRVAAAALDWPEPAAESSQLPAMTADLTHPLQAAEVVRKTVGGGRMIFIGSTVAIQPVARWGAFSTALGGLKALVEVADAELRNHGIYGESAEPFDDRYSGGSRALGDAEASGWVNPRTLGSLMLWLCSEGGGDVSFVSPRRVDRHTGAAAASGLCVATIVWPR